MKIYFETYWDKIFVQICFIPNIYISILGDPDECKKNVTMGIAWLVWDAYVNFDFDPCWFKRFFL